MDEVTVLELFSGIGGMHSAIDIVNKYLPVKLKVIGAIDINTVANEVYRHNFPHSPCLQKNITGLTPEYLRKLGPDMVTMSPPCQPHTRQGKQLDRQDPRSSPLEHLMEVLPKVDSIKFLLLENVCGFEKSASRELVVSTLKEAGFNYQEFLLCPRLLGIPNSRLRYYLLAKRSDSWSFEPQKEIIQNFDMFTDSLSKMNLDSDVKILSDYLEVEDAAESIVPDTVLSKHATVLDIVRPDSRVSCCFTSGYYRYCEGTGSVIQSSGDKSDLDKAYADFEEKKEPTCLSSLKLRYFIPQEIAKILGFQSSFTFPDSVTVKQRYKVLGNSINVTVVSLLIFNLLS